MLRFTVPEALTLLEQVSARLRPVFEGTIPLGNRLTVAQFAQVYRWRGIYDVAGRAWSVWRVARMFNPATAATYELREKLSNSLIQWLKGTISGRLVRAFIHEVRAASIDLYSGQLKKAASNRKTANLPATIRSPRSLPFSPVKDGVVSRLAFKRTKAAKDARGNVAQSSLQRPNAARERNGI